MSPMISMEAAINPSGDTDVMLYVVLSMIGLCLEFWAYGKLYNLTMDWLRKLTGGRLGNRTYPPNPPNLTQVVLGMAWGGILALLGLVVMIPVFGGFGIFWTLVGALFALLHAWQFFVKKYPVSRKNRGTIHQLDQLESLRAAGLMTDQEYQQKKKNILGEL